MFFEIWRHLTAYDATCQLLPVNLVLRYTSFIWLFGAYFLCFWYWCTHHLTCRRWVSTSGSQRYHYVNQTTLNRYVEQLLNSVSCFHFFERLRRLGTWYVKYANRKVLANRIIFYFIIVQNMFLHWLSSKTNVSIQKVYVYVKW